MSEQDTQETTNTTEESTQDTSATDTQKTFTQEELEKTLSDRLKREREKADKALADKLKAERADWERQAKLSAEEKAAEEAKRREKETSERERGIILRENRADARELLQAKNISADLVDFVVDVDADKTKDNIDNLEKAFLKAVEAGVNDRLKGQTPTDKSSNSTPPKSQAETRVL